MKSKMKVTPLYILVFLLILPSLSFAAGGWTGESVINKISLNKGNIVLYRETPWPNPDFCASTSTSAVLVVTPDNTYYSEIYALFVASFLQGATVNIYTLGCYDIFGTQYPKIDIIDVTN